MSEIEIVYIAMSEIAKMTVGKIQSFMQDWAYVRSQLDIARVGLRRQGLGSHGLGTVYKVKPTVVRSHRRRGYVAVRLKSAQR